MHYEINVSQRGHHVFATHPRSLTTFDQAAVSLVAHELGLLVKDGAS